MTTRTTFEHSNPLVIAIAAALAGVVSIGLLSALAALFLSAGTPMARLVEAERVCVEHRYVSERESCIRDWLAASSAKAVASR